MNEIRSILLIILHYSYEDVYASDKVTLNDGVSEWNICTEGSLDYYNCGFYIGVFGDCDNESYFGKLYWYDETINDFNLKHHRRDNILN